MSKCRRCGRVLKNPEAIAAGIGPVCAKKVSFVVEVRNAQLADFYTHGLVCQRATDGTALCNVRQSIISHSPTGIEWGYGGSGPADLALNVLALLVPQEIAEVLHQDFKWQFIAPMPKEGGTIPIETIRAWINKYVPSGAVDCRSESSAASR